MTKLFYFLILLNTPLSQVSAQQFNYTPLINEIFHIGTNIGASTTMENLKKLSIKIEIADLKLLREPPHTDNDIMLSVQPHQTEIKHLYNSLVAVNDHIKNLSLTEKKLIAEISAQVLKCAKHTKLFLGTHPTWLGSSWAIPTGSSLTPPNTSCIPDGPSDDKNIFRRTINLLTGRLLIFDPHNGETSQAIATGSGMIIPRTEMNGITYYDKIVTCSHCVLPDNKITGLEFYFIRSSFLSPQNGEPHCGSTLADIRRQCNLAGNNMIRRVECFKPIQRRLMPGSTIYPHSILAVQIPRYLSDEDVGYGTLSHNFNNMPTNFLAKVAVQETFPNNGVYYTIGYPSFKIRKATVTQRIAPFCITQGDFSTFHKKSFKSWEFSHEAPTSVGMSGGVLCTFIHPTRASPFAKIRIYGVIKAGSIKESFMVPVSLDIFEKHTLSVLP